MKRLINNIWRWILSVLHGFNQSKIVYSNNYQDKAYSVVFNEDEPEIIESGKIYILGKNSIYWQISLLCPCGCLEKIHLNLLNDCYPYWNFNLTPKLSIRPSIWRTKGCRSHFWIENNNISWVEDFPE